MPRRVGDWLKIAGELRDGFLVIAAVCYSFGYIVWAITAYRNDLGLLPALDFQYFVAGVPPLLVFLGLYYIVVGGKWLQKMAQDWLVSPATRGKLFLSLAMVGLAAISFILILVNVSEWFKAAFPKLGHSTWFVLSLVLIIIISGLFFPAAEQLPHEPKQADPRNVSVSKRATAAFSEGVLALGPVFIGWLWLMRLIYIGIVLLVIGAVALTFATDLHQKIPQEFGGARPRSACLDVIKAQISGETIAGILPVDASKSSEPVVRSLRVEVLFSGSDVMVVRSEKKVYRLTKSTIETVTTCN